MLLLVDGDVGVCQDTCLPTYAVTGLRVVVLKYCVVSCGGMPHGIKRTTSGVLFSCAGQGDGDGARDAVLKMDEIVRHEYRCVVTPNVSAASPSYQDDEINMSWNMDYVPYMARQEYRRQFPDLDEEMAEIAKTHQEEDRHFYSAILEFLKEQYREQYPDEPDSDTHAQAEYDAYMAANPGLKERLIREEEEERAATMYSAAQIEDLVSTDQEKVFS